MKQNIMNKIKYKIMKNKTIIKWTNILCKNYKIINNISKMNYKIINNNIMICSLKNNILMKMI